MAKAIGRRKHCPRCDEWKSRDEFSTHRGKSDGLQPWCRACIAAATREARKGTTTRRDGRAAVLAYNEATEQLRGRHKREFERLLEAHRGARGIEPA